MKRLIITMIIVIYMFTAGLAFAKPDLPSAGVLTSEAGKKAKKIERFSATINGKMIAIKIPFIGPAGYEKADWTVSCSLAIYDKGKQAWSLQGKTYRAKFVKNEEGNLYYTLPKPKDLTWYRVWGETDDYWLHIDQESIHSRSDRKNNPGYEFIVDPTKPRVMTVPQDYDTRL